ncbi:hypothetical protein BDP27DRAFT_829511 [Rhodocollybia butyracea]|uniref:Uncharacterized protein n=1 Tax=Rhodocollybia butyracea TaxID=206335 RepID=A0A9P5U701_9AGAR|nr:hypothetical protein BDP27DRAFT_829511 [Rhodocollybia butyracea]
MCIIVKTNLRYDPLFQGDKGRDWFHNTTKVKTIKGWYSYDVYTARAGVFVNYGDGGWENWAYAPKEDPKLVVSGWEKHTLQYTGGATQNHPQPGQCELLSIEDKVTKHLILIVKDGAGATIGFTTNADPTSKAGFPCTWGHLDY